MTLATRLAACRQQGLIMQFLISIGIHPRRVRRRRWAESGFHDPMGSVRIRPRWRSAPRERAGSHGDHPVRSVWIRPRDGAEIRRPFCIRLRVGGAREDEER